MSYYLDMGFVNVKDKIDAINIAMEFCNKVKKDYKEMLDIQKYYIPEIRMGEKHRCANMYWLYGVFTFNFVYWDEFKLLGIKGCGFPAGARKMFNIYIPFQNGTDQDYEFEEWGDSINLFNEVVEEFRNADIIHIKNTIIKKWGSWEDEMDEDIEYYRRTSVYEEICQRLNFYQLLDDNDGNFERFSVCAINTQSELMDASQYVRYLVHKDKEEEEL